MTISFAYSSCCRSLLSHGDRRAATLDQLELIVTHVARRLGCTVTVPKEFRKDVFDDKSPAGVTVGSPGICGMAVGLAKSLSNLRSGATP